MCPKGLKVGSEDKQEYAYSTFRCGFFKTVLGFWAVQQKSKDRQQGFNLLPVSVSPLVLISFTNSSSVIHLICCLCTSTRSKA